MYVSSEFQLGQVYMGETDDGNDDVVLYRPVYVCVPHERLQVTNVEKEGMVSRVASRLSMTRLNDKLKFKEPKVETSGFDSPVDSPQIMHKDASPCFPGGPKDTLSPLFSHVNLNQQVNSRMKGEECEMNGMIDEVEEDVTVNSIDDVKATVADCQVTMVVSSNATDIGGKVSPSESQMKGHAPHTTVGAIWNV